MRWLRLALGLPRLRLLLLSRALSSRTLRLLLSGLVDLLCAGRLALLRCALSLLPGRTLGLLSMRGLTLSRCPLGFKLMLARRLLPALFGRV